MNNKTDFVDRLRRLRKELKLTQAELAPLIHLDRAYISQLESGKREIQPWLQERIEYLEMNGVHLVNKGNAKIIMPISEVLPNRIPVVSWATAGWGKNFSDMADQIDEWLVCDCRDANAYALIIEGDSMTPNFLPGDRVVFSPNQEAQNGDCVVARIANSGDVFFKLYHLFGPRWEMVRLTSFNPAYPPIERAREDFRFVHPMHSLVRKWRR